MNADGTFTYTADTDYVGSDSFVYEVCDDGEPQACDQATVFLTVNQEKKKVISLVKTGRYDKETNTVLYIFTVKNIGKLALSNVVVTDVKIVSTTPEKVETLAAGENAIFKAVYTPTEDELNAGIVTNTAIVTAKDSNGKEVSDISGTDENNDTPTETEIEESASAELIKTAVLPESIEVGELVTYTFVVNNTGNVKLTNVTVNDAKVANITPASVSSIASGATATFTGSYVLTQSDVDARIVTNTAEVTATTPDGTVVTDVSDNNTPDKDEDGDGDFGNDPTKTVLTHNPSISISKTSDRDEVGKIGEIITYTIVVTNTGDVTLYNVVVEDPLTGFSETISELLVKASVEFTTEHEVTVDEVRQSKQIINVATVVGKTLKGEEVSASADKTVKFYCPEVSKNFMIPQVVSRNSDGYNDGWEIPELAYCKVCGLTNKVMIFNRWGAKVYEKEGYMLDDDRFRGYSTNSLDLQDTEELPAGVYFYIIEVSDRENKTGYFYILEE